MIHFVEKYPYPELTGQLQILCTPAQYNQITENDSHTNLHFLNTLSVAYLDALPYYTFAQCPICGKRYKRLSNTYNVRHWPVMDAYAHSLSYAEFERTCKHYLGIDTFVNLHDQEPYGIDYFSNHNGEVPRLTPWFLPDDIPSFVVLHALPICSIAEEKFLPTYTAFFLTYFSEDPKTVLDRKFKSENKRAEGDSEYYPAIFSQAPSYDMAVKGFDKSPYYDFDLNAKAEQGQLGWLDFKQPNLPLIIGQGKQVPDIYQAIEGKRYNFIWRNGKLGYV